VSSGGLRFLGISLCSFESEAVCFPFSKLSSFSFEDGLPDRNRALHMEA